MPKANTATVENTTEEVSMGSEVLGNKRQRGPNRSLADRVSAFEAKIEYHRSLIGKLEADRDALIEKHENPRKRSGNGRGISTETRILMEQFASLTPEQLAEAKRKAQRELNALVRVLSAAANEGTTAE